MERPTIVVIDDEPEIVGLVCEVLEDEDLAVVSCTHGYSAYPCICAARPQVVILDVQMPGVDGLQVFEQMRADPATQGIPVIFFTANGERLLRKLPHYQSMGAKLLPKPFDLDKLLTMVGQALGSGGNIS